MPKENICYYCKHWQRLGVFGLDNKCARTGEKKASCDTCQEWKDEDE